jgi:Protein of unknown function (DUF1254)
MIAKLVIGVAVATLVEVSLVQAQSSGRPKAVNAVPVTVDNFGRGESDLYFGGILKNSGGIGKFLHRREPARIENQTVIRLNRDTLYSSAVFDLDAGPVTIALPDAGKRFMSMQVIQFGGCDGKTPNCLPIARAQRTTRCGSTGRDP